MAVVDPNLEWLGYVQPIGLVLSSTVLDRYGLVPEEQTRADGDAVGGCLAPVGEARALVEPWSFFSGILGWREHQVAGLPGGQPLPAGLSVLIDEADSVLEPRWAVVDPEGRPTLLIRIEEPGVELDQRRALAGWEATPHQRFERLLRENEAGVRAGILLADDQLRLVYAPKGETSGWLSFPVRALATVAGRPMLGGLKLALGAFRLHNDAPERRLPALLKESRDAQDEVSAKLAEQVLGALYLLLRGLYAADDARIARLAVDPATRDHLYGGLLTVLLRLVFLLYAEDRGLIPSATDEEARRLYDQGYGARALHAKLTIDAAHYPDTMEERRGAWARLLVLFRLIHNGGGDGFIKGRGGDLFDPTKYPFLLGQDAPGDRIVPAPMSDGCILGVLDRLLLLDGDRLSYRTLDVEQIGSVYETVMGFTVKTMEGPALPLRGGKNDKVPVFVDIAQLAELKGSDRQKRLKDGYNVKLPDKVAKAVSAAKTRAQLEAALKPRVDVSASPGAMLSAPGAPLLQPTDERRRTGSHYTPRTLTEPIVRHALELAFERLGPDAEPDEVLALKVCDPAMGSGAFLVEACRQLAARLAKAWTRWPETRPPIPADEDEELHAKRLVAQRCLYGVDKNPRAVELAKLSLWLATLAREHEFTFLDHALKCGDSLVGLNPRQIAAMNWDASKPGLPLFRKFVADRVAEATKARAEIQSASDDARRAVLEQKHRNAEKTIEHVRVLGDAVVSAFFAAAKPRAREKRRAMIESWITAQAEPKWDELRDAAASLHAGEYPVRPFHWAIEFPEVFSREEPGFDAMVGNPPFLGGTRIATELSKPYVEFIKSLYEGAGDRADLVAYFFRRSFMLTRDRGSFGLIASNTIAQGDTRKSGLGWITKNGGTIYRAIRRYKWIGEAAVVVGIIHVCKCHTSDRWLNNQRCHQITSFLFSTGPDDDPSRLAANSSGAYEGMVPYSDGFMHAAQRFRGNTEVANFVLPYARGKHVNSSPVAETLDLVAYFRDLPMTAIPGEARPLLRAVEEIVRPDRASRSPEVAQAPWWIFWRPRMKLWNIIKDQEAVLLRTRVSPHHSFIRYGMPFVPDTSLVAFPDYSDARFAALQSRLHEVWARFFASSMKDDLRYTPSDCFETFPFPDGFETSQALKDAGQSYHDHRAALMVARNEGMTKTYNRFHDPDEPRDDIVRLRELHVDMDRAMLRAYGWDDLAKPAEPIFLDETNEGDHVYQGRLFWPSAFRDEVLARLLALNAERAAAERAAGHEPVPIADGEGADEEDNPE